MSFAQFNLRPNINKALTLCGYQNPTPVQSKAIPVILNGRDVVVSAPTGTGKTAAFVLPALHRLDTQGQSKKPRILILTPTRELATQITKAARLYGKLMRFNIVNLVGGMPYHHQIKDLARGADIIVATPGRLLDHIEQKRVDLSHIEMLVLDEADRMLDMGFIDDVQYIAKLTPENRQTLLFSATLDNQLMKAVKHLLKNPERINLSHEKIAPPKIKQTLYKVSHPQQKSRLLKHFLNDANIFKAIIFSATKMHADKLAAQLRDDGLRAAALHGDLRQNVRNRTVEQLRQGKIQFLVATDVAARGIDISDVTHVINYDLPKFCEDYVHRIGRTGRAGKEGTAISFVLPTDMRHLQKIERFIGQRIQLIQSTDLTAANESFHQRDFSHEEKSFAKKHHAPRSDHQKNQKNDRFSRDKNKSFSYSDKRNAGKYDSTSNKEHSSTKKKFSTSSKDHRSKTEVKSNKDDKAKHHRSGFKKSFADKKSSFSPKHPKREKRKFVNSNGRAQLEDKLIGY